MATNPDISKQPNEPDHPEKQPPPKDEHGSAREVGGEKSAPGFQVVSFAALSVFQTANFTLGERRSDVRVLSEKDGHIRPKGGATSLPARMETQTWAILTAVSSGTS